MSLSFNCCDTNACCLVPNIIVVFIVPCKFSGIDVAAPRCWCTVDEHKIKTSGRDITLHLYRNQKNGCIVDTDMTIDCTSFVLIASKLENIFLGNRFDVLYWPERFGVSEPTNWWKHYVEIMLQRFCKVTPFGDKYGYSFCLSCSWYIQIAVMFPEAKLFSHQLKNHSQATISWYIFRNWVEHYDGKRSPVDIEFIWEEDVHCCSYLFTSTTTVWCPKIQWICCSYTSRKSWMGASFVLWYMHVQFLLEACESRTSENSNSAIHVLQKFGLMFFVKRKKIQINAPQNGDTRNQITVS